MQNIPAGKIECGRDLCLPDCLAVPLPLHQLRTGKAELNPGIGVNGIVDTAVAGAEAPEQLAVGGVDNGVALQRGDVALPQVNAGFQRGKVGFLVNIFNKFCSRSITQEINNPPFFSGQLSSA